MLQHWRFQPKLTLLYSVLFLIIFVPVIAIVQATVINGVTRSVERELQASGAVFQRIMGLRRAQLEDSATIMAGDFGFRAAVATQDAATVNSALSNIVDRVGASQGFVVDLDGTITAATGSETSQTFPYANQLNETDAYSAAALLSDRPHLLVAAPIKAPLTIGWVVFALELDQAATSELEALSPVPIKARIQDSARLDPAFQSLITRMTSGEIRLSKLTRPEGEVLAHLVALPVLEGSAPITLVLTHDLDVAFQPYRAMFTTILLLGVAGMLLLAGGSWFLSARVTRPLAALTRAVDRLKQGQHSAVDIPSQDEFGALADGFNTMSEEITTREQAITHMAMHDGETDLPNRRHLEDQITALISTSGTHPALLIGVRLKRFANVRAAIGYDLSADFMRQVAQRLGQHTHAASVARLTVDTLAVSIPQTVETNLETFGEALRTQLSQAVELGTLSVDVNVSLGMVCLEHADTVQDAVQKLELALDHGQAQGLQTLIYSTEAISDPAQNLSLMSDMQAALTNGEIRLHYQPKVDTRTGQIAEVEALLRWIHPERGFVPPDLFVEMAEETGHISELTEWVVERAITDQRLWAEKGLDVKIGVNMSGRLLSSASVTDFVIDTVTRHGADPKRIVLEITETAVMDNPDAAIAQLHRLREAGFALSIDDYGTGLSSLTYLKDLPVTEIKIDKSFVLDMASNEQDRVMVRSTIDLARNLGLTVTAEGVEDQESFAALQLYGCDFAQGYFISKAISSEAFEAFAETWNSQSDARISPPSTLRASQ